MCLVSSLLDNFLAEEAFHVDLVIFLVALFKFCMMLHFISHTEMTTCVSICIYQLNLNDLCAKVHGFKHTAHDIVYFPYVTSIFFSCCNNDVIMTLQIHSTMCVVVVKKPTK